ncbi:MAG: electron transfer flavoprotein subunit alpha [Eubacteriales bacterium]|nr:electron transfer flavoprotein subunit alpha [Eubacteriales bacterium]
MANIALLERKCTSCGKCAEVCPFGAITMVAGKPDINSACKMCNICVKNCPEKALYRLETRAKSVDKSKWNDILVFAETSEGKLHPVTMELIGKAQELAKKVNYNVNVIVIGHNVKAAAEELLHYGVNEVAVYDDEALGFFRADVFADCAEDYIKFRKPSTVLIGATSLGRSLAPRISTRFRTGLTADCTVLDMKPNSDLVQIRPAFGGNIMAQIVTENTRPQFATVRYKIMDSAKREDKASGNIIERKIPKVVMESPVKHIETKPIPKGRTIADADILVVGGRGLKKESDLILIQNLAKALNGDWATTRPLVEKGWASVDRQVGMSGRTVKPKLIIVCGVSGAIQFTACMDNSEYIIAINTDEKAQIFGVAHLGLVGDLYDIVPKLTNYILEKGKL